MVVFNLTRFARDKYDHFALRSHLQSLGISLLMTDPQRAPLVRRAFEEYATGRFTKEQLLKQATAWGLTNRRERPLTSQAIGMLLRNQLYAGIVDVPRRNCARS